MMGLYSGQTYGIDPVNDPYAAFAMKNDSASGIGKGATLGDMMKGNFDGSGSPSMGGSGFGTFGGGSGQGKWLSGGGNQPTATAQATTGGYGAPTGQYTPDQTAAVRKFIAVPGSDQSQLLGAFGGDQNAMNNAINAHSSGGALYDPGAIAQMYQQHAMEQRGQAATAGAGGNPGTTATPALPGGTAPGAGLSGQPSSDFGNLGGDGSNQFLPGGTGLSSNPTQMDTGGSMLPPSSVAPGLGPNGGNGDTTFSNFNEAPGNYTGGMTLGSYLNPAYSFARDEGLRKLQSSYAGAGNFLSGNALRGTSDYLAGTALNQAYQPAMNNYMNDKQFNYGVDNADRTFGYNAANNDRQFNYGVDTGNRAFDYAAQTGDRAFDADTAKTLGNFGIAGAAGAANSNSQLAAILAQLAQSAGQAQGTGTIGGSNAITNAISSILQNMNQNTLLDRILKPQGG